MISKHLTTQLYSKIFSILVILICVIPLRAQTFADKSYYLVDSINLDELTTSDKHLIDSALTQYYEATSDTGQCKAIMLITQNMVHEDWYKYNQYLLNKLQEMLADPTLSKKVQLFSKQMLASVLGDIGYYYNYYRSDIPTALVYFQKALKLSKEIGDKHNMATMLNNIGSSSESIGDITGALQNYHESLMICEEIGNKKGMPSAMNNIGLVHLHQGNYTEALDYFERSLRIHEELGEKQNMAINLEHIGTCYRLLGNEEKTMEYRFKSLKIAEEIGDNTIIARELKSISEEYVLLKDLDKASEYAEKSHGLYEEAENKRGITATSTLLGKIALQKGQLKKAKTDATESLLLAQELGFPNDIRNAALLWSNISSKEGNYKKGLEMYKLYITMRDSILNEETKKSTIKQQAKHEFEKAQLIKEQRQKEEARIQKEQATQQANFQYAIILVLLLLIFLGIAFMSRVKITPKVAEGIIYMAILILFESSLVVADPYVEILSKGEPVWKLLMNVGIAMLLFPLNTILDKKMKSRIQIK